MYYKGIKEVAIKMRKDGFSLGDISKKVNVSKSTISFWCKDIYLSNIAIKKISKKGKEKSIQGLLKYSELKRKERIERNFLQKKEGASIINNLSKRDILMIGFGLYWGEGYKYENCELGFTNSNPKMIIFYFKWLELFGISKDFLIFRLTMNKFFTKKETKIKNFWIKFLGVKKNQFTKTTFIKTDLKKAYLKEVDNYKGILRVKVRNSTHLRNKILGGIEHISNL